MNYFNEAELLVLDFIREHLGCAILDRVMPIITLFAEGGIFWISAAVIMLFFKKTRKTGAVAGLAMVFGLLLGNAILKPLIARVRPYDMNTDVALLVNRLSDYSFPSGHTLVSFEAAGAMLLCGSKKFGYPALALAILIAFSRLYLYVHYPSDVFAGIILGLLLAYISFIIVNKVFSSFEVRKASVKSSK
ncbi:MAG: phosphatase PAP2 family protein [Clostridiales bacterium]|nr:phosphatase PAP2 family protein [Clostridiales bacterium]